MITLVGIILLLTLVWCLVTLLRLRIVHNHLNRRIDEVYASKNWYKYHIDIDGSYDRAMWDFRKWSYHQFFPEVVE